MIIAPPTQPILFAQLYSNPVQYDAIAPATPTGSSDGQKPVETISVESYLKSRFIGALSQVTTPQGGSIGRGIGQNIVKTGTHFTCDIASPQNGVYLTTFVIFEGYIKKAPTRKRWAMAVNDQIRRKRILESESQLSIAAAAIGSDSQSTPQSPSNRIDEPTADVLPNGEPLIVCDLESGQKSVQNVVIYKGAAYLSNGVPMNVRLEYQP